MPAVTNAHRPYEMSAHGMYTPITNRSATATKAEAAGTSSARLRLAQPACRQGMYGATPMSRMRSRKMGPLTWL